MDTAAKVFVFLGSAMVGSAAMLVASEQKARAREASQAASVVSGPFFVDLRGAVPIAIECVKKPLPVFSVYQY